MAREGTRSATGNSKPRVFDTPDTAPAITRKPKAKTTTKPAGSKPVGVTKTKKTGPVSKACYSTPVLLPVSAPAMRKTLRFWCTRRGCLRLGCRYCQRD